MPGPSPGVASVPPAAAAVDPAAGVGPAPTPAADMAPAPLTGMMVFKAIRQSAKRWFWPSFVLSVTTPEDPTSRAPLRALKNGKRWGLRLREGVLESYRLGKSPFFSPGSPHKKTDFSKAMSVTLAKLGDAPYLPDFFGRWWTDEVVVGVTFRLQNAQGGNNVVLQNLFSRDDMNTVTRNHQVTDATELAAKTLKHYKSPSELIKGREDTHNECLARLRWACDGSCWITVFTDDLASRLRAQLWALDLANHLKRLQSEGKGPVVPEDYKVPIRKYVRTNKQDPVPLYDEDSQQADRNGNATLDIVRFIHLLAAGFPDAAIRPLQRDDIMNFLRIAITLTPTTARQFYEALKRNDKFQGLEDRLLPLTCLSYERRKTEGEVAHFTSEDWANIALMFLKSCGGYVAFARDVYLHLYDLHNESIVERCLADCCASIPGSDDLKNFFLTLFEYFKFSFSPAERPTYIRIYFLILKCFLENINLSESKHSDKQEMFVRALLVLFKYDHQHVCDLEELLISSDSFLPEELLKMLKTHLDIMKKQYFTPTGQYPLYFIRFSLLVLRVYVKLDKKYSGSLPFIVFNFLNPVGVEGEPWVALLCWAGQIFSRDTSPHKWVWVSSLLLNFIRANTNPAYDQRLLDAFGVSTREILLIHCLIQLRETDYAALLDNPNVRAFIQRSETPKFTLSRDLINGYPDQVLALLSIIKYPLTLRRCDFEEILTKSSLAAWAKNISMVENILNTCGLAFREKLETKIKEYLTVYPESPLGEKIKIWNALQNPEIPLEEVQKIIVVFRDRVFRKNMYYAHHTPTTTAETQDRQKYAALEKFAESLAPKPLIPTDEHYQSLRPAPA